jgi:hypothetical protein
MRRLTALVFIVSLVLFALFAWFNIRHLVPPPRPSPPIVASVVQPVVPVISINYAKGATEIHDLKIGEKYFGNRSASVLKLAPEIAGLQFAFRSAGHQSDVTFLAPVGSTVFLLIDSDHGSSVGQNGVRQLNQSLRRSGWKRLPSDAQLEPANKRALLAVYQRDFNSLTRLTIVGAGASGIVVVARQLVLADAAFTAALHPSPPRSSPTPALAAAPSRFNMLLHNPIGWFILGFALLIGSSLIYQILVFLGIATGRPAQWARKLEAARVNDGWRIPLIPVDDDGTLIQQMGSGINSLFAVGGVAFVGCCVCLMSGNERPGIELLAGAAAIVVAAMILQVLRVRQDVAGWEITPAHCLDREIREVVVWVGKNGRTQMGWLCRAVCEFKHAGQTFSVTPVIRMSADGIGEKSFGSEQEAQAFISAAIDAGGKCQLRVNPNNPRQTELFSAQS